ncbi:MAG TPA: dethiobiotin synthase [Methyloceanibacter sp.]|nr:dethiobiotin synthase [Methyloceanibacter sp.]
MNPQPYRGSTALQGFFVTGTDTDVGKTLVSAWLLTHLDADYWKPVQAGTEPDTDSVTVRRLAEVSANRILPEAYILPEAMAPHEAARRAGIRIDMAKLEPPATDRLLVVEGAGGLLVPLNDTDYVIDLAAELHLPIILVARSTLGTINHTLLSIEALRRRGLPFAGVVMSGPETPHNRAAIEHYGDVNVIAEIPWLPSVTRATLLEIEPELDLEKLARAVT